MESLEELADQRDQLKEEERKILTELGGTRAKVTKLRDELHTLRKNRDDLNETVKALKKTRKLSEQIGKYRIEADEIHAKIQELAAQSQAYHLKVVDVGEKFQGLRDSLDGQRKMLDEIRLKASEVGRKYALLRTTTMQAE